MSNLERDLWTLDAGPSPARSWNDAAFEVLGDTVLAVRSWRYTRRQVVVLGVVCGVSLAVAGAVAILTAIIVRLVLPLT